MKDKQLLKGIGCLLTAAFFFSLMQALSKMVSNFSPFARCFYFSIFASLVFFIIIKKQKGSLIGNHFLYINLRALFGFVSTIFIFLAATGDYPLANVSLLSSTSTIFALVAAVVWLHEKMKWQQWLALVISCMGVFFIVRPQFSGINIQSVYGLLGGMFAGFAYTVVRKLKDYANPMTITFYFSFFSLIASFIVLLFEGFPSVNLNELFIFVLMGISTSLAQLALGYAYRFAESSKISVYMYSQSIFAFILGFILWQEIPSLLTILGATCILLAGYINFNVTK